MKATAIVSNFQWANSSAFVVQRKCLQGLFTHYDKSAMSEWIHHDPFGGSIVIFIETTLTTKLWISLDWSNGIILKLKNNIHHIHLTRSKLSIEQTIGVNYNVNCSPLESEGQIEIPEIKLHSTQTVCLARLALFLLPRSVYNRIRDNEILTAQRSPVGSVLIWTLAHENSPSLSNWIRRLPAAGTVYAALHAIA